MKKLILLALAMAFFLSLNLTAQDGGLDGLAALENEGSETPHVRLMHFIDVEILLPDDEILFEEDLELEMALPVGATVITGEFGKAELELIPNKSIIKLSGNTNLSIDSLAGLNGSNTNGFSMETGKLRVVAAALTGKDDDYAFKTESAVCGVRGTDFGMEFNPGLGIEEAFVLEGVVDYSSKTGGPSVQLGGGQMASAVGDAYSPLPIPSEKLALIMEELGFDTLNPEVVPTKPPPTPEPTEEPTPEAPEPTPEAPVVTAPPTEETPPPSAPAEDNIPDWLKELLGMELGSITIGDQIYGKVVFQPTISVGKLKTALYLPIIYEKDMFNPDDWYFPKGNNEWSFGTDQDGALAIATDVLSDLFLKIKYFQWGEQRDPFWIKLGNLNNFTIGHGLLMYNYANDADFPAIRKVGVNMGMEREKWGFEAVVNDLAEAEIIGGRVSFKIFGPASLGVTGITDIDPAGDLPETDDPANDVPTRDSIGNPVFINLAVDLDLPISEAKAFKTIGFLDIGGMLPYFRTEGSGDYDQVTSGASWESLFYENSLNNYGISTGLFGRFIVIDYRLAFNYFTGSFRPAFFNTGYDRTRGERAIAVANMVQNPGAEIYDDTLGIYGEGHFEIPKIFSIELGYMAPLAFSDEGSIYRAQNDEFHIKATLDSGVIPFVDLHGSITYDRTNFIPLLLGDLSNSSNQKFGWIDEYAVLKGELVYGVSKNVDLIMLLSGAVARDENGNVTYDENGKQEMDTTFSIETSVHF